MEDSKSKLVKYARIKIFNKVGDPIRLRKKNNPSQLNY